MKKTKIRTTNLKGTIVFAVIAIILVTFTTFNPTTVYASDNEDVISHYQSVKAEVEKRTEEIKNSTNDMNKAYYSVQTVYNQNGSSVDTDSHIDSVPTNTSYDSELPSDYYKRLEEHKTAIAEQQKEREEFEKAKSVDDEDESFDESEITDEYFFNQEDIQEQDEVFMQDYLDTSREIEEKKHKIEAEKQEIDEKVEQVQSITDPLINNITGLTFPKILLLVLILILFSIGAFLLRTIVMSKIFASRRKQKEKDNNNSSQKTNNQTNNSSNANSSNTNSSTTKNANNSKPVKNVSTNSSTTNSSNSTPSNTQQSAHGCVF